MKLKLPPKLKPPYTLADWLDLEYDKDPKFTKALKLLNLALINLKRTNPPEAAAFEEFTAQTAFLILRLKKMLKDDEMPAPVMEFCEPFLLLLKKWQKGATKLQDILLEEDEEDAAESSQVAKAAQQAAAHAKTCIKNYTTLAQAVDKAVKDIAQLAAIVARGVASPKIDAAISQVRSEKLLKTLLAAEKNCAALASKLPGEKQIEQMGAIAQKQGDKALAAQVAACSSEIATVEKLSKAVSVNMEKYAKAAETLLKTSK